MTGKISISSDGGVGDINAIVDGVVEALAMRTRPNWPRGPSDPETWHIYDVRKGGPPTTVVGTVPQICAELEKLVRGHA